MVGKATVETREAAKIITPVLEKEIMVDVEKNLVRRLYWTRVLSHYTSSPRYKKRSCV